MVRTGVAISEGEFITRRQVPPYWPTASNGVTTTGLSGSRSSTGGRVPAATISASIGASLYSCASASPVLSSAAERPMSEDRQPPFSLECTVIVSSLELSVVLSARLSLAIPGDPDCI
jgi:hypothetical protein